jgi:outer membrane protein assembly factor BamB
MARSTPSRLHSAGIFVATENNSVYAPDEDTGKARWSRHLGTPGVRSQVAGGCGNIDPIGITGTPVIDPAHGLLYAAGLIGSPFKYQLWAVRVSDGTLMSTRDLAPPGLNLVFQQERGALALANGTVYGPRRRLGPVTLKAGRVSSPAPTKRPHHSVERTTGQVDQACGSPCLLRSDCELSN